MGVNVSKVEETEIEKQRRKLAEKMIVEGKKRNQNTFKLLLLGTADAGKSTIIKQMRILHGNGFHEDEIEHQRNLITGNILQAIGSIIRAMRQFGITFENEKREADAEHVLTLDKIWPEIHETDQNDWAIIKALWTDGGVQACFLRSDEYQIPSSTKYFCDSIDRISSPDYVPTQQDMLYSRINTTAIVEIEFTLRGLTLKVIDVGGQRSQRKKWIHCFENINGIIYLAAINEYNQTLTEDTKVAVKGIGFRKLIQTAIDFAAKFGSVSVDEVLPAPTTL